jgi:hypothetical protein
MSGAPDLFKTERQHSTPAADHMIRDVTWVITSCGRPDLLQATIESFLAFNTYPIKECILIEDSGAVDCHEHYKDLVPFPTRTLYNGRNLGQMRSIDIAYSQASTPYLFHCEDDWQFFKSGFIEASLRVLDADPKVITVWLRAHNDTNGHPIEPEDRGGYRYLVRNYRNTWNGFTLNPGLRRTRDIMRLHPYEDLETLIPKGEAKIRRISEADLSIYYRLLGYRGAITADADGYVRHIGWGRHVKLEWE